MQSDMKSTQREHQMPSLCFFVHVEECVLVKGEVAFIMDVGLNSSRR